MRISARTHYACLAALQLAADFEDSRPTPLKSLCSRQAIPEGFLVQILQDLRRAGLVVSTRGAGGGYRLTQPPGELAIAEVIAAVEAPEPLCDRAGSTALAESLDGLLAEIDQHEQRRLGETTLADLVESAGVAAAPMWYI